MQEVSDIKSAGLGCFPCKQDKTPKVNKDQNWKDAALLPIAQLQASNIWGLMIPSKILIIDLDLYKGITREDADKALGCSLPWDQSLIQTTQRGGEHHAFVVKSDDIVQRNGNIIIGLDFKVGGKGYICFGNGYTPTGLGILRLIRPGELPRLPDAVHDVLRRENGVLRREGSKNRLPPRPPMKIDTDVARVEEALGNIDPDCTRDQWRDVGFSLKHGFGDDPKGLELWDRWSSGEFSDKGTPKNYKSKGMLKQWESFKRYGGVTIRNIYYQAGMIEQHEINITEISKRLDASVAGDLPMHQEKSLPAESTEKPLPYNVKGRFLDIDAQRKAFDKCVYIRSQHYMFTPNGMMNVEQFNAWTEGATFALSHDGDMTTKKAFDAFVNSQGYDFPKADTSCFRPEIESGKIIDIQGTSCVNTYIPAKIRYGEGDVGLFIFLMCVLFPNRRDYNIVMNYFAACVQYVGVKSKWCLAFQGVQGNGKGLLTKILSRAIGEKHTHHAQTDDISNKFNGWIENKLFILVDEVSTIDKRETMNALKVMISEDRIPMQKKGVDTVMIDNRANFIMSTNHKDSIMIKKDDRRIAMFIMPQQTKEDLIRDGLTEKFFKIINIWLDKCGYDDVAGYLKNFKIQDEFNFATTVFRAPETSTMTEAIENTRGPVYDIIEEAIEESRYGFRGGWISSYALNELLERKNISRFFPLKKRKDILEEIGYIAAPWMANGRASKMIPNEGSSQPRLYVQEKISTGEPLTVDDYVNAQAENHSVAIPGVSPSMEPSPPTPTAMN